MLSSVASRVYWAGRYLERAENTARLLNVYSNLLLDLPPEAGVSWDQLVRIAGCEEGFGPYRRWPLERNALKYMTSNPDNSSSIGASISAARFNVRSLRDVMPTEASEAVNELNIFAQKQLGRATSRRLRFELLSHTVESCQQITGLFAGTMNHGEAYQFLRLGQNLERADMTTRIVDVAGELLQQEADAAEFSTTLWVTVLRSLSAYQAYRQSARSRISSVRVLNFLLNDPLFPRSITYALRALHDAAVTLPANEPLLAAIKDVADKLNAFSLRDLARERLHSDMDTLQQHLSGLHDVVERTWFAPHEPAEAVQARERLAPA